MPPFLIRLTSVRFGRAAPLDISFAGFHVPVMHSVPCTHPFPYRLTGVRFSRGALWTAGRGAEEVPRLGGSGGCWGPGRICGHEPRRGTLNNEEAPCRCVSGFAVVFSEAAFAS